MKRLRNLGLLTDLFSTGIWEREAEVKERELLLLAGFEAMWRSGRWHHLSLPFQAIIDRWRAEIAKPLHFASIGPATRWVPVIGDTVCDWRQYSSGSYRKTWRELESNVKCKVNAPDMAVMSMLVVSTVAAYNQRLNSIKHRVRTNGRNTLDEKTMD